MPVALGQMFHRGSDRRTACTSSSPCALRRVRARRTGTPTRSTCSRYSGRSRPARGRLPCAYSSRRSDRPARTAGPRSAGTTSENGSSRRCGKLPASKLCTRLKNVPDGSASYGLQVGETARLARRVPFLATRHASVAAHADVQVDHQRHLCHERLLASLAMLMPCYLRPTRRAAARRTRRVPRSRSARSARSRRSRLAAPASASNCGSVCRRPPPPDRCARARRTTRPGPVTGSEFDMRRAVSRVTPGSSSVIR